MFHQVSLQPRQRQFELCEGESILAAGLRAGLRLRYGCSNGNCGECVARLLRGATEPVQHADFPFSEVQRAQGCLLMCSHTARSDVELEVSEIGSVHDVAHQQLRAKVSRIERFDNEHVALHLRTPRSALLQFLAGQDVWADFGDGSGARRLALANCPCDGMRPQFHLRRRSGDPFSEFVFSRLRVGDACELSGPVGDFVLGDTLTGPLLFIAYETGFAAVNSLLEQVIALDWPDPLRLLWLGEHERGVYRANYCRALQDALDDFELHRVVLERYQGDFAAALDDALQAFGSLQGWRVFAVVPVTETGRCDSLLRERGARPGHLRVQSLAEG